MCLILETSLKNIFELSFQNMFLKVSLIHYASGDKKMFKLILIRDWKIKVCVAEKMTHSYVQIISPKQGNICYCYRCCYNSWYCTSPDRVKYSFPVKCLRVQQTWLITKRKVKYFRRGSLFECHASIDHTSKYEY